MSINLINETRQNLSKELKTGQYSELILSISTMLDFKKLKAIGLEDNFGKVHWVRKNSIHNYRFVDLKDKTRLVEKKCIRIPTTNKEIFAKWM